MIPTINSLAQVLLYTRIARLLRIEVLRICQSVSNETVVCRGRFGTQCSQCGEMNMNTRTAFESLLPGFGSVRRDLERALQQAGQSGQRGNAPCSLSMWHDERTIYVAADVPGCTLNDLEVKFDDGKLYIRGERAVPQYEPDYNERRFGRFERTVAIADVIDTSSIQAELVDGVLTITMSKRPESQPLAIQIKRVNQSPAQIDESNSQPQS